MTSQRRIPVAVYHRCAATDTASLNRQREVIEALLARNPHYQVFRVYEDIGVSGLAPLALRPAGNDLLDDAQDRRFEKIILSKPSTLSRNERGLLRSYAFFFDILGIEIVEARNVITEEAGA